MTSSNLSCARMVKMAQPAHNLFSWVIYKHHGNLEVGSQEANARRHAGDTGPLGKAVVANPCVAGRERAIHATK